MDKLKCIVLNTKSIRFLGFKKSVQNDAIKYTNKTLTKAFKKIDDILQGAEDE